MRKSVLGKEPEAIRSVPALDFFIRRNVGSPTSSSAEHALAAGLFGGQFAE